MEHIVRLKSRVDAEDVTFAYHLFLTRNPENDAAIQAKMDFSLERLPIVFLESAEFEVNVLRPVLEARHQIDRYAVIADKRLSHWARDMFGANIPSNATLGQLVASVLRALAPSLLKSRSPQLWSYLAFCLEAPNQLIRRDSMHDFLTDILFDEKNYAATQIAYDALLRRQSMQLPSFSAPAPLTWPLAHDPIKDADRTLVEQSGLWDAAFYLEQNPELTLGADLLSDFISRGSEAGLDPHPLFSSAHYRAVCCDSPDAVANPLIHYLRQGHLTDFAPNILFSPDWYRRTHLLGSRDIDPLGHYAREGAKLRLQPHPLFDRSYYEALYPDVALAGLDAYQHYVAYGRKEGRRAFDFGRKGMTLKVAVVAHIFYEDLWPELFTRMSAVPADFDLIATVSEDASASLRAQILTDFPRARIIETPNHGRDIGPFLHVFPILLDESYDLVCKIHTKRGVTEPDTWRYLLLESVLGSKALVQRIMAWFEGDADLSIVGGNALYLDGAEFSQLNTKYLESMFSSIYGDGSVLPLSWGFFAGTMFWIRPQHFSKLLTLVGERFEGQNSLNDGQSAHALERIFGVMPTQDGRRVGLIDIEGAHAAVNVSVTMAPNTPSRHELASYLPQRTRELSSLHPEFSKPRRRSWLVPNHLGLGVNFIGPVEAVSGLGVSARGFVKGLEQTKLPLTVTDWTRGFEGQSKQSHPKINCGEQPINIVHLNLDFLFTTDQLDAEPLKKLMTMNSFNIAIIYWELSAIPPEWISTIDRFDEIWVSSHFMARAVAAVSRCPVRVIRPAVLQARPDNAKGDSNTIVPGRFLFAYSADAGSILNRKNPQALWRAYAEAFSPTDGAALAIKLHRPSSSDPLIKEIEALASAREDVIYISHSLSESEMASFFDRVDCYVSPHRSEGLGLTILEAMQAGKPVISTAYGGAADFVTPQTAFVIDHRLAEVGPGSHPYPENYVWADPVPDSLSRRLREVFENPDVTANKIISARKMCESLFATEVTAAVLYQELSRIWQYGGGSREKF